MDKAIFLRVEPQKDSAPVMVALPGQTYMANGKEEKVKTTVIVLPRTTESNYKEGERYATNQLSWSKQGWYVCGNDVYKVTDETGMIFTGGKDDPYTDEKHKDYCQKYRQFLHGDAMPEAEHTDNGNKRKVKSFMERLRADKTLQPPTIENDGWYVDTETWWYLVRNLAKRKNTLMIGKSGAGKTELVRMLAPKLQKVLNVFDMAVSNPNKTFCGNLRAENGTTHFQYARFANVIQEPGVVLLDEISRAAPTANNLFLPVLDNRRTLYIEDAIHESQIEVHKDCLFWATANIGAEFIGTSGLDHALMNRFNQIAIHYPPKEMESKLLQKKFQLSPKDADAIVHVATGIRDASDSLSKDISTRQVFEVAELVADGYSKIDAFAWSVLQQFEANDIDGGERATVLSIIQSV